MSTELTNAASGNAAMANRYIPTTNVLEATLSDNGNSSTIPWIGGKGYFTASGTFGSGTCKLQYQTDGTNWDDVGTETTLTASGGSIFELPLCNLRVNLASATAPSILVEISNGVRY